MPTEPKNPYIGREPDYIKRMLVENSRLHYQAREQLEKLGFEPDKSEYKPTGSMWFMPVVKTETRQEASPHEEELTPFERTRREFFAACLKDPDQGMPAYVVRDPEGRVAISTRHINYAGLVEYLWTYLTPSLVYFQDQMSKEHEPGYTDQAFEFLADYMISFAESERPRFTDAQLGMLMKVARNAGIVSKDYSNTLLDNYHTLVLSRSMANYEQLAKQKREEGLVKAQQKRAERRR